MFRLEFTSSRPIIVLTIVLAVFLVIWTIQNIRNSYYPKMIKYILTILRIAALVIFILFLSDVRMKFDRDKQTAPDIAFLWDLSQSVYLTDSSFTVKDILNSKEYKELERKVKISHIHNMQDPAEVSQNRLKQLPQDERASDIGALLRYAESQARFDELVLVSDGKSFLGEDLENISLSEELKVNAIGIGKEKPGELPEFRSLNYPPLIFEYDSLHFSWFLYNPSEEACDCELIIKRDKVEVGRLDVRLPAQRMIPMNRSFFEGDPGIHEWEFYISSNNEERIIWREELRVHEAKINIVFFSDPPDRDIAMMATVLRENERYRVFNSEEWKNKHGDRRPDLIIQTWHPEIHPRIEPDIPTVQVYRVDNSSYLHESDLKIVVRQPYVNFLPDPAENELLWTLLPPIQVAAGYSSKDKVIIKSMSGHPVVIENHDQRSITLNASGMWKWNLAGYDKDWNGFYSYFIDGLAEILLWQFENSYISLDEDVYTGLEFEVFPVAVRKVSENVPENAKINLRILDSNKVEIRRYELIHDPIVQSISLDREGQYFVVADIISRSVLLESDTSDIRIKKNDMELRDPGCDEDALRKLTEHHHGNYLHLNELDELPDMISINKKWVNISTVFTARRCYLLYVLMFLMLVADWVIRKRNGGI